MQLRKQEGRRRRQLSCKTFNNTTINLWGLGKTHNLPYFPGRHLDKEENKKEKFGFSSSSFDGAIAETGRGAEW